jgi:(5-formylfuran-3-yl)methyl phosphate synthase
MRKTRLLVSVNCLQEAQLAYRSGADIIDMKQPSRGALGALDYNEVEAIVKALPENAVTSATIGDLPMTPAAILPAVQAMSATGVDFVKIGFFPEFDPMQTLAELRPISRNSALIAVLFADSEIDNALLPQLAQHGFRGVMLDTQIKTSGSLRHILSPATLERFTLQAKQLHMLCGLAGSLRISDIEALLPLQADYLGFRGGLCDDQCRTNTLDQKRVESANSLLDVVINLQ